MMIDNRVLYCTMLVISWISFMDAVHVFQVIISVAFIGYFGFLALRETNRIEQHINPNNREM